MTARLVVLRNSERALEGKKDTMRLGSSTYNPSIFTQPSNPLGEKDVHVQMSDQHFQTARPIVCISGDLHEMQTNPEKSVWTFALDGGEQPAGGPYACMQRIGEDGVPRGALNRALLRRIELRNTTHDFPFPVLASLYDGATQKTTMLFDRNGNPHGAVIPPGYTKKIELYALDEASLPLNFLQAASITAEDLRVVDYEEKKLVSPNSILGQHVLNQNYQAAWIGEEHKKIPFQYDNQAIYVNPDYLEYVLSNIQTHCTRAAEQLPAYFTNLANLSFKIAPLNSSWKNVDTHPTLTKMMPALREVHLTKENTFLTTMEMNYAIVDNEVLTNGIIASN